MSPDARDVPVLDWMRRHGRARELRRIIESACSGPEVDLRGSNPTSSTALSRGRPARRALSGTRSGRGVDRWALVLARGRPKRGTSSPSSPQRRRERTRRNADKGRRRAARLAGRLPSCAAAAVRRLRAVLRRSGISQVQTIVPLLACAPNTLVHPLLRTNWPALLRRYGRGGRFVGSLWGVTWRAVAA